MTDIEKQALALVQEGADHDIEDIDADAQFCDLYRALCLSIERFNAFKQEVSDAVQWFYAVNTMPDTYTDTLGHFIIAKPDPLVEAMHDCGVDRFESWADQLRAALAARGLEIREVGHD